MAQRIQLMTADGVAEYAVYNDYREMVGDYDAGILRNQDEVIYREQICMIEGEYTRDDGEHYLQLLISGRLGPNITFSVCG